MDGVLCSINELNQQIKIFVTALYQLNFVTLNKTG